MSTVGRSIKLDNKSNSVKNQVELAKLAIPIKEDSGTESGEDLRSIAAGICDQLQVIDNTSVIDEVTAALERLERSLREGRDITIDIEKRKALLELVWRLQAGLKSPEKLSEIAAAMSELEYGKMSLETDTVYSNKHRFAKRRGRVTRHTIGVSHEELASARRHILKNTRSPEKLMDNQSVSSWYSLVPSTTYNEYEYEPRTLQSGLKPEQFTYNSNTLFQKPIWSEDLDKKRPLSGNYSEQFSKDHSKVHNILQPIPQKVLPNSLTQYDADIENVDHFNSNRKYFIRRANTIDIPKAKKDLIESNTGSENEEKNSLMGLKSVIQVGVKKPPEKVIPPFEAKTENDRKFLAFINKHSDKPGLISSNSRSVSNWSNKFDSLKHNFELGAQQIAKKPPQMPGHVSSKAQWNKLSNVQYEEPLKKFTAIDDKVTMFKKYPDNQKAAQSSIHDNHFDKHRKESENLLIPQHNSTFHKPIAINQFKHASSSVFKRVENIESKPIHDAYSKMDLVYRQNNTNEYPNVYTYTKADNYFVQTPPPSTNYVPSLPWAPKLNDTKNEMNNFKETNESSVLFSKQLNSAHMAKSNQINEYKKRPSLPNTSDINRYNESIFKQPKSLQYTNLSDLPPPTNISIIYANGMHRPSFNSSPCLSTAMQSENLCSGSHKREDSLTNPDALPLVLTADNPLYAPGELQHTSLSSTSVLSTPSTLSMYPENNTESPILTEHHAISKVMNKPQSLTAVTIEKRTNHVSDNDQFLDGNTQSAKNLLTAMKSINKTTNKNAKSDKKVALNQLNCEFAQNLSKLNSLKPTNKSLNNQNLLKSKPEQMYATSNSKINKAEKCLNNMAPSLNLNCEKYTNTNASSSIQSKQVSNLELDKTARKNPSVPINAIMEKKPTLDQKIYNISYEINNNKKKIRKEHVISESSIVGKEICSNAAPLDTPDIVKSSLPKDESQTVLKNYGPPQRHHYVPNAYQNPLSANTYAYKKQQNINSKMAASNRPQEDDYIPRNIVHNNVSAFTCLSRNQKNAHVANFHKIINSNNASMQKAQFHIPQITQTIPKHFNCPILSPSELRRSKSGHNLSVPKMYEAGINKADIDEKQKTVAAYFLGQKSPTYQLTQYQQYQQQQASTESSSVLRRKSPNYCTATNEVNRKSLILNGSIQNVSPSALSRSATMPHIPNVHLLDESNVEDAFEQLISGVS